MITIKEANFPVAENAKRIAESKDLKKKAVAGNAGLTNHELTDIFGGRRIIKACEIGRLAGALGVGIEELFRVG